MSRRSRRAVAIGALMLMMLAAVPATPPAAAQATRGAITVSGAGREAEPGRWWGVAGAMLCGWGMRFIRVAPEVGMNPYVLAATLGGCVLALMDAL